MIILLDAGMGKALCGGTPSLSGVPSVSKLRKKGRPLRIKRQARRPNDSPVSGTDTKKGVVPRSIKAVQPDVFPVMLLGKANAQGLDGKTTNGECCDIAIIGFGQILVQPYVGTSSKHTALGDTANPNQRPLRDK